MASNGVNGNGELQLQRKRTIRDWLRHRATTVGGGGRGVFAEIVAGKILTLGAEF